MMKENIRLKHSLIFPILFIILIWTVKLYEISLNLKFYQLGIYPLSLKGTLGILTAPLIHADLKHLISNTFALLTLSIGLFYLYKKYAYQIFGLIYILTNILVWIFARNAFHIGASGIIYGLAAFLFFTGIFSKKKNSWQQQCSSYFYTAVSSGEYFRTTLQHHGRHISLDL